MIHAALLVLLALPGADPVVITADTVLDPAKTYGSIVIKASNVTVDGRGATIVGATSGDPKTFKGVGIRAEGVSSVTIKNVVVKGFETGLHVSDGSDWRVTGCDFSDNFHDPEFGWGEQGRRGGILLERVRASTLENNKANRVWDACSLVGCRRVRIVGNDFSHTSNACLKLWDSSDNSALRNNLRYGLRIKTGEVHARDSTGVLIESGSDRNILESNDVTHGGDGIFVRVLNGWVSRDNLFRGNDVSYANNNGFEAWSPNNTYINNKANHCSYGFWLGASDKTVLIGNEASHNGQAKGFHNSPHLPKDSHAGIVFMFGTSSHTLVRGNTCVGNNGAGIALIGEPPKFKAYHWVIEGNTISENTWGIYARHADWIVVAGNTFAKNGEEFSRDASVTNVVERTLKGGEFESPLYLFNAPMRAKVGEPVEIVVKLDPEVVERSGGKVDQTWSLGDGSGLASSSRPVIFKEPGLKRIGVTLSTDQGSVPIGHEVYVVDDLPEIGVDAKAWTWSDPSSKVAFANDRAHAIAGSASVRAEVRPYSGGRVNLAWSAGDAGLNLDGKSMLIFWIKSQNSNIPGWQGPNPVVAITGQGGATTLTPKVDRLAQPVDSESREGWTRFAVPLKGGDGWDRSGDLPGVARTITIGLDSWGADPLTLWIDGMSVR